MNDRHKTKEELVAELAGMRRRLAEFEALERERKQAEEGLRESEERYRSFVQSFPGIAYRGRIDFSVVFFHGAVEEITGYSEHDFTSRKITWDQVICPDEFTRICDSFEKVRLVPNYSTEREYRIFRKDGEERWVHDVIHNVCDSSGKPAYVQGVVYDVTDRKQVEEALVESEQWARCMFETVPLGITECTVDGVITRTNPAYREMLGYSGDELVGRSIVDLLEDGPDKEALPAYLRHLASDQPTPSPYLCRDVTKDGRRIDVQVDWTYRRDRQGEVTGFVSVLSDITQKKRAETALRESEEALREAHDELEQRVKDRTVELEEVNQRLEREIEQRRAAHVSLRESEERYRTLVETSPQAVVMSDLGGRITFASRQALRLHGSETLEGLYCRDPLDFVAPQDHDKFRTNMQKILEEGVLQNVQYTFVRKDGTPYAAELSSSLIRDASGQPQAMMAIIQDITERKEAEEALRQSHDQLQAIYDGMVDGLVVVDIDTQQFRRVNSAMCRMVGYTEDELQSMTVMDIHPPEASSRIEEDFKTLAQGRPVTVEGIPVRRKDGSVFYADIRTSLVAYNGRPCSTGFFRDITERKRTEKALHESHAELQAVHRGMFDGLAVAEVETKRLVHTNPAIHRMLGYSEEELLSLSVMDIHPSDDLPEVLEKFKAQAEGRLIVAKNIPVLRKDKSVFYADIATTAIDYRGRRCNIGVFHDITARKLAEEALRREYRVLRQMLQAQDRERQLVAYEIHDGLAQQLTGATMQFDSCEQLKNENPQQASDCFSAGCHLLKKSLAEARRLIAGLRPPILDESGIVAAVAHLVHDVMSQGGPDVEFQSSVRFDRLEPLLENAIFRIAQEGLANFQRHSQSDKAQVRLVQEGERVRIEVHDWGIGFHPESVEEKCFGLAGIRERARVLGGEVSIRSTPGEGSQIVVELPIKANEGDLPWPISRRDQITGGRLPKKATP